MGTHAYALVEVSSSTYQEIRKILEDCGWGHAINRVTGHIDMHGLAVVENNKKVPENAED